MPGLFLRYFCAYMLEISKKKKERKKKTDREAILLRLTHPESFPLNIF